MVEAEIKEKSGGFSGRSFSVFPVLHFLEEEKFRSARLPISAAQSLPCLLAHERTKGCTFQPRRSRFLVSPICTISFLEHVPGFERIFVRDCRGTSFRGISNSGKRWDLRVARQKQHGAFKAWGCLIACRQSNVHFFSKVVLFCTKRPCPKIRKKIQFAYFSFLFPLSSNAPIRNSK